MPNLQQEIDLDTHQISPIEIIDTNADIEKDFKISGKTAIARAKVSAPLQILIDNGEFTQKGSLLHYGKGRSNLDSQALKNQGLTVIDYDYVWCYKPDVLGHNYNYCYLGYVLNTLPPSARDFVYKQLVSCCGNGIVYIAVRSDKIKGQAEFDGVRTSKNTFQKSYFRGECKIEAQQYFKYVEEIKGKSGMQIVKCSNNPF